MKAKLSILLLLSFLLCCKKDNNVNVVLNGALSTCETNFACTYNFYEHADLNSSNQLVTGNDRVFDYSSVDSSICNLTNRIYFKTSLNTTSFDINSAQIAAGQATYLQICACCDYQYFPHAIGGEIKGKKTGANQWLVNATIVLGGNDSKPVDTLTVNQYFSFKSL